MIDTSKYIAFSGGECVGKSTQIKLLKDIYPNALFIREPGSYQDKIAQQYREYALNKKYKSIGAELEYLLQASRNRQLRHIIIPALKENKIIFSDRSWYDGLLYGVAIEKQEFNDILFLCKYACTINTQTFFPKHNILFKRKGKIKREINQNNRYDNRENEINPIIENYFHIFKKQLITEYNLKFYEFTIDMNNTIESNQQNLRKLIKIILN